MTAKARHPEWGPPIPPQRRGRYELKRERAAAETTKALYHGLGLHGARAFGSSRFSEFVIAVRDANETLRGGFWVEVHFGSAFLKAAWIDGRLRGKGMGRTLLAMSEEEARRRHAKNMWLDTFSFQARPFYEKMGYAVFGTLQLGEAGLERYWMVKAL